MTLAIAERRPVPVLDVLEYIGIWDYKVVLKNAPDVEQFLLYKYSNMHDQEEAMVLGVDNNGMVVEVGVNDWDAVMPEAISKHP
jgi:hypothetical protein